MLLVICGISAVRGQQSAPPPRFDVASVKESLDSPTAAPSETPNGVNYQSIPLSWLISRAFAIPEREIVGGPDWIRTRRFNITARTGAEAKSRAEFPPMLQALLQDRFGSTETPRLHSQPPSTMQLW
jgi:uncharacterized protein (TIGR03435 family)